MEFDKQMTHMCKERTWEPLDGKGQRKCKLRGWKRKPLQRKCRKGAGRNLTDIRA